MVLKYGEKRLGEASVINPKIRFYEAGAHLIAQGNGDNLQRAIAELVQLAAEEAQSTSGSFYVVDWHEKVLKPFVTYQLPSDYVAACGFIPLAEQCCGRAAHFRRPRVVSDMLTDPLFASAKKAAEVSPIRAAFSVPVIDENDQCLGALACHYHQSYTPTPQQVAKNQLWASMIAHLISEYRRMQQSEVRVTAITADREKPPERWRELCRLIAAERDPVKFDRLVVELDAVLNRRSGGAAHQAQRRAWWKEIATQPSRVTDRGRGRELADHLEGSLAALELPSKGPGHLAENSACLPGAGQQMEYEKIVDAAVALMGSDFASMQMLFPERGSGGELLLLTFRGFNPEAARFWEWVRADSKSTCGIALRDARRVVAPDIAACDFMADSEDQQVYLQTGIYACQTTPLIGRRGNILGMLSTHWRTPHQPSAMDLRQLDTLASQAADLIERDGRAARR